MLAFKARLEIIEILAESFARCDRIQALNPDAFEFVARYASTIFTAGLLLAPTGSRGVADHQPVLGILNRGAPQLTIFSIGFPMTLTVGLVLIAVLMQGEGTFWKYCLPAFSTMREFLALLAS